MSLFLRQQHYEAAGAWVAVSKISTGQGGIKLPESCEDGESTENSCVTSTHNPLKPT